MSTKTLSVGPLVAFGTLCEEIGTPYAALCHQAYREGGMIGLEKARQTFSPAAYHNSHDFAMDYLVHTYVSKLDDPKDLKALDAHCLAGFLETEKRNADWNRKLKTTLPFTGAESLINSVRRKIRMVLGDFSYRFVEYCDWGPGATYSLASVDSTRDKKILENRISITKRAVPYFLAYTEHQASWFGARTGIFPDGPVCWLPGEFDIVRGERFATAPKKWNSRRTISIQPTGNLFLQKGFGTFVRKRLKRVVGIDLDDQSRNQLLAAKSWQELLATLDLKEASNSMLVEHIRLYFDEPWVNLMEDLRCPEIRLPDGSWHRLELHSAMGNGYTFEVESLIFWALAQSVVELFPGSHPASVYGDDVIVPQQCAEDTILVFEANGFRINTEKSFTKGDFFESCGKHYFQGHDVTPIYEKKLGDSLHLCIRSFNRLSRWAKFHGVEDRVARTLRFLEIRAYQALLSEDARRTRFEGRLRRRSRRKPRGLKMPYQAFWMPGDGGLVTEDTHRLPDPCQNGVWTVTSYVALPVNRKTDGWSILSDVLRKVGISSSSIHLLDNLCPTVIPKAVMIPNRVAARNRVVPYQPTTDRPSYGFVTPRDETRWEFRQLSFYDWAT